MDLKEYIKIFKRRKIPILLTSGIIFGFYLLYAYCFMKQPPKFQATSTIILRTSTLEERV